jgi:hypothetical protein
MIRKLADDDDDAFFRVEQENKPEAGGEPMPMSM